VLESSALENKIKVTAVFHRLKDTPIIPMLLNKEIVTGGKFFCQNYLKQQRYRKIISPIDKIWVMAIFGGTGWW
jgi:hypothetical protein